MNSKNSRSNLNNKLQSKKEIIKGILHVVEVTIKSNPNSKYKYKNVTLQTESGKTYIVVNKVFKPYEPGKYEGLFIINSSWHKSKTFKGKTLIEYYADIEFVSLTKKVLSTRLRFFTKISFKTYFNITIFILFWIVFFTLLFRMI